MKDLKKRSPSTAQRLVEVLERENAELRKSNAKLLRMVEMVMEERFFRPTITGGVRENHQTPGLPLESLSDVAVFDESADAAQSESEARLFSELNNIADEHRDWRKDKGLDHEEVDALASR